MRTWNAVIERDAQTGLYVGYVPGAQGDSREEAKRNIVDAIEGYLASLKMHGDPIPPPIIEELVEVAG